MDNKKHLPVYDLNDAIKTIRKHSPLIPKGIIKKVLCGNDFYLKKIGCLNETDKEIKDTYK